MLRITQRGPWSGTIGSFDGSITMMIQGLALPSRAGDMLIVPQ